VTDRPVQHLVIADPLLRGDALRWARAVCRHFGIALHRYVEKLVPVEGNTGPARNGTANGNGSAGNGHGHGADVNGGHDDTVAAMGVAEANGNGAAGAAVAAVAENGTPASAAVGTAAANGTTTGAVAAATLAQAHR